MTFSIAGFCRESGALGMAVSSSSIAVAGRCAWVRSGTGIIATQNLTNPHLGPLGLDLLARGHAPAVVRDMLLASDRGRAYRQLLIMDRQGCHAHHTGEHALPVWAQASAEGCAAAGNLLAGPQVPARMVAAFECSVGRPLAQRLLDAMHAGLAAGGEVRDLQSAGLLVADDTGWNVVDLRVDQHAEPLTELQRLWTLYAPLQAGYADRVLAPERYTPVAPA